MPSQKSLSSFGSSKKTSINSSKMSASRQRDIDTKSMESSERRVSPEDIAFLNNLAEDTRTPKELLLGFFDRFGVDIKELKQNIVELNDPASKRISLWVINSDHTISFEIGNYKGKKLEPLVHLGLKDINLYKLVQEDKPDRWGETERVEREIHEILSEVNLKRMVSIPKTILNLLAPEDFKYVLIENTLFEQEKIMGVLKIIQDYVFTLKDWKFESLKVKGVEGMPTSIHIEDIDGEEYVFYIAPYVPKEDGQDLTSKELIKKREGQYIRIEDLIISGISSGSSILKAKGLKYKILKMISDRWWELNKAGERVETYQELLEIYREMHREFSSLIKELYGEFHPEIKKRIKLVEQELEKKNELLSLEGIEDVYHDIYNKILEKSKKRMDRKYKMIANIILYVKKRYGEFEKHMDMALRIKSGEISRKMEKIRKDLFKNLESIDNIRNMNEFNKFRDNVKDKIEVINEFVKDLGWE